MENRSDSRTLSFIILSVIAHVAIAAGVMTMNSQSEQKEEAAPLEISAESSPEIQEVSEAPVVADLPKEAEAPVIAKEPALPSKAAAVAPPPPPKPAPKAVKAPKIPQTLPQAKAVAVPVAEEPMTQEESPVVVPVTQNEAEEPTEEQPEETPVVAPAPAPVQAQEDAPVEEEKPAPAPTPLVEEITEPEQKEDDTDEKLVAAEAELKAQEEEQAAKEAAAAAAAAKLAEEARQAEAAKQAEEAKIAESASIGSITGQGGDGSSPSEARNLESLRQMPGNKRPQYDRDDQANGRQGQVSFKAYVSKEGAITELQLARSSGHRELDAKSLKAIKSWKFYPGQEGWVEIPFQWDLKGEPQQRSPIRSSSNGNQASRTE